MNMYQLQFMSFARIASTASLKRIRNAPSAIVHTPSYVHGVTQFNLYPQHRRTIQTTEPTNKYVLSDVVPSYSIFSRSKEFIKYYAFEKYIYRAKGSLLYRHSVDSLDYIGFMKDFQMPDTYYSWFLITELHVWMLLVKLTADTRGSMEARKHFVKSMWIDADVRRKKLGGASPSVIAPHMEALGHQFNAALIGYDEGLMSNDQVLAGAVWRRIFQSECNNPEFVEKIVAYIRKNINMLDNIPGDELINRASVTFIKYDQVLT